MIVQSQSVGAELELELDYVVLETKSVFFLQVSRSAMSSTRSTCVRCRPSRSRTRLANLVHQSSNQSSFFYLINFLSYCVYCTPFSCGLKTAKQLSMIHK
jgi:hypothetical protein